MNKEIKSPIQRTACPFYGFNAAMGMFIDQEGNQCPLKGGYSPCHMEMQNEQPDWKICDYNKKINIGEVASAKIFPREFHPVGARSWGGMEFKTWAEYILEKKQPEVR